MTVTPSGRIIVGVSRSLSGLAALRYAVAESQNDVAFTAGTPMM